MRLAPLLAVAALGAACGSAGSSPSTHSGGTTATGSTETTAQQATLMIRHQKVGCHDWSLNGDAWGVNQTAHLSAGSTLAVTDADVMPHTLVETAGPGVAITNAHMNQANPHALVKFLQPGTYSFITKAGEDYVSGVSTIGEDHVLRLTVIVS